MNTDALQAFGLSEKEARVYLAALRLGTCGANDIALQADLPRTLVYDILERLIVLGVVSYSIRSGKKAFLATDPEQLLLFLKEKETLLRSAIPEMLQIQKVRAGKKPKFTIYEGVEGMKSMMSDILRSGEKQLYVYGSSRSSYDIIPAFIQDWHEERIRKKIKVTILYNNTPETRKRLKKYPKTLAYMKYRLMPITVAFPTATFIYGNKVVMQLWTKEPFAIMIDNEAMARNQQRYVEALWRFAKPIHL